ncbi:MAG: hypothetical protein HY825_19075 [Acidobacteria bacterium]|nr:hypothetical protein [Acidobacteriota bacterium]
MLVVHHEQTYPNACIPACMCMIQTWRGLEATEGAFHHAAWPNGHSMTLAERLGRVRVRAIGVGDEADIDLALELGRLVLATVCGPPYVRWFCARYPSATSVHGPLCPAGDFGKPRHALLLVERLAAGYRYHDPWYPAAGQPFEMSDEDFQRCFAGEVAIAAR